MTTGVTRLLAAVFLVAMTTPRLEGSILLSAISWHEEASIAPCVPSPVEFYLADTNDLGDPWVTIARSVFWGPGESGVFGVVPLWDDHEQFDAFAEKLTNGIDGSLWFLTSAQNCPGENGTGNNESYWLGRDSDLVGNQLEMILVYVQNVQIHYAGGGITWSADTKWEFWGTPVPEPGGVFALLTLAAPFRHARMRRFIAI